MAPAGAGFEDAWFQAADGTRLHGWYVPHPGARGRGALLHGNAGNITASHRHPADAARPRRRVGADLRLSRLRAERGQAQRAGRLGRRPGGPGVAGRAARRSPKADVVLMGESMGGAVAVESGRRRRRPGAGAGKHVQHRLPDVAAYHYPWLPVRC